jgi:hypothetical protein
MNICMDFFVKQVVDTLTGHTPEEIAIVEGEKNWTLITC